MVIGAVYRIHKRFTETVTVSGLNKEKENLLILQLCLSYTVDL